MANTNYGITSAAITWEVEETEVSQDEVAFVSIDCRGVVSSNGATLDTAMALIPKKIPISASGPVRLATAYTNAELQKKSARYADGNIEVTAKYRKPVADITSGPGGGTEEQTSESDRTSLRLAATDEPILTHPVVQAFPKADVRQLKNLIEGDIRPNPLDPTDTALPDYRSYEFVTYDPVAQTWSKLHTFSPTTVTSGGITASPYDFARFIAMGIDTYRTNTVSFKWSCTRKDPISPSELNKVSTVLTSAILPVVTDRQWLYEGASQDQVTDGYYTIEREFILSKPKGFFAKLYVGGTAEITTT
jgi:hypothetical protein